MNDILQIGHPVLRQKAKKLTQNAILSDETQSLISKMYVKLNEASAVGLAAPQIGVLLQIIVVEDKPEYTAHRSKEFLSARERKPLPPHTLINPVIVDHGSEKAEFYESCLSIVPFAMLVPRFLSITVEAYNEKAEKQYINASGWYARILQHEIDHLNGILAIDRMKSKSLTTVDNYKKWLEH